MKKLAVALAITASTISFQASALQVSGATSDSTALTVLSSMTSSSGCETLACKSSVQIIEDAQEYYSTGKMSEYLAAEVRELKAGAGNISDDEAVDILVDFAHRSLELY